MSEEQLFATREERRLFLQAWIALEILFAAWSFAIMWHPNDQRSFIIFVPLALCFLPFEMQVSRVAARRRLRLGVLSPSLRWEVMLAGPYEALRAEGMSRALAVAVQSILTVLPLATAVAGATA